MGALSLPPVNPRAPAAPASCHDDALRVTPTLAAWSWATSTDWDLPPGQTDAASTPNGVYLRSGQAVHDAPGTETDPFLGTR